MWPFRKTPTDWIEPFGEALAAFARSLPPGVAWTLEREHNYISFEVAAPTPAHRSLTIEAGPGEIEYRLGKLWTERLEPTPAVTEELLAACEAVRDGWVREVVDRDNGLTWHLYRLRRLGPRRFVRDSEYSFRHSISRWTRHRIRRVSIRRVPPLGEAA